jgi:hypothetical protein
MHLSLSKEKKIDEDKGLFGYDIVPVSIGLQLGYA